MQKHQAKMLFLHSSFAFCLTSGRTDRPVVLWITILWVTKQPFILVFDLTWINHMAIWLCVDICRAYFLEHNLSFGKHDEISFHLDGKYWTCYTHCEQNQDITLNQCDKKHRSCAMHVLRDKGCYFPVLDHFTFVPGNTQCKNQS